MNQVSGNDNTQSREKRGVFDTKSQPVVESEKKQDGQEDGDKGLGPAINVKQDYHEPSAEEMHRKASTRPIPSKKDSYDEDQAAKINKSMADKDMYDDINVNSDDLKLAEKLIFDGFAETDVSMKNFPDRKFTLCSTNAEELGIMDEILFDMVKDHEKEDGMIDLPQNHISSMRSALFIALGYRGMDKQEICDTPGNYLNTIKKAVIKLTKLELDGNIKDAENLRISLKHALKTRAVEIKRLPTPLIDWLSGKKAEFDKKMYKIMCMENIIPKS